MLLYFGTAKKKMMSDWAIHMSLSEFGKTYKLQEHDLYTVMMQRRNSISPSDGSLGLGENDAQTFHSEGQGPQGDNNTYCMMKVGNTLSNKGAGILKVRIHR